MFTGIVQKLGRVAHVQRSGGHGQLVIEVGSWLDAAALGESIGVQGVCLTLTKAAGGCLYFDVLNETFEKTNLGDKKVGSPVNLERALRVGDAIGGHFVTGHVDGVGVLRSLQPVGRDWIVEVVAPDRLLLEMVHKGSIALDGISLTIVDLKPDAFTVHIIPHTYEQTTVHALRPGDRINLETDMLGKYVHRILTAGQRSVGLSWDTIRAAGLGG